MTLRLAGYTHVRELGSGAGGTVLAARHDATGVAVAIKYLSDALRADPEFVRAYRSEARIMSELHDQRIARLYEYVEDESQTAIVMELVDGVSLAALLRQYGALIPEAALFVMFGSLSALAAAHELGLVHRDYKPANVMVNRAGDSVLLDFGIAARSGASGMTSGSPAYMAPEQWRGESCSPAGDVYAVTATFVECVTGRPPFVAPELDALARQHQNAPVPAEALPEPVRDLVRAGLAKDPAARPATAAEFIVELSDAAVAGYGPDWAEQGRRHLAARVAALLLLLPFGTPELAATDVAATRFGRRLAVGAGAAVIALAVGGGAAAVTPVLHHPRHHVAAPTRPDPTGGPTVIPGGPGSSRPPTLLPRTVATTPVPSTPGTDAPVATTVTPAPRTVPHVPAPRPPTITPHTTPVAPTVVQKLAVTGFAWGNGGAGPSATSSLYVATSGTGAVHLSLEYQNGLGFDRGAGPFTLSGATIYHPTDTQDFSGVCGIITVTAKTDAGGFASMSLPTAQC